MQRDVTIPTEVEEDNSQRPFLAGLGKETRHAREWLSCAAPQLLQWMTIGHSNVVGIAVRNIYHVICQYSDLPSRSPGT